MIAASLTNGAAYNFSNPVAAPGTVTPSSATAAMIVCIHTFGGTSVPTFTGCGLTWTEIPASHVNIDGSEDVWFLKGVGTAVGGTTPEASGGGFAGAAWTITELTSCNVANPIIQAVKANAGAGTGSGTSAAVTLAAFEDAANQALFMCVVRGGQALDVTGDLTQAYYTSGLFGGNPHYSGSGAANDTAVHLDFASSGAYVGIAFEIDEAGSTNYSLTVTAGQGAAEGQIISAPGVLSVDYGQATANPYDIALLFDAAYVIPVTSAPAAMEGQQIPFIYTQPGTEGSAAAQGSDISLLAQALVVVDYGGGAGQGQNITLIAVNSVVVDAGQAAMYSYEVQLTATGLPSTGDGVIYLRRRRRK